MYGLIVSAAIACDETRGLGMYHALNIGMTLFFTTMDIGLDIHYAATQPFANYWLWLASIATLAVPTLFFFVGTGALRHIFMLPWMRYAYHTVQTVRGRKPWGHDIDGTKIDGCRVGLAVTMNSWDNPLVAFPFFL